MLPTVNQANLVGGALWLFVAPDLPTVDQEWGIILKSFIWMAGGLALKFGEKWVEAYFEQKKKARRAKKKVDDEGDKTDNR